MNLQCTKIHSSFLFFKYKHASETPYSSHFPKFSRRTSFSHIVISPITERSYKLIEEFRKYVWDKDKNGSYINVPIDDWNHGIDAVRYYVLGILLGKIKKPVTDYKGVFRK